MNQFPEKYDASQHTIEENARLAGFDLEVSSQGLFILKKNGERVFTGARESHIWYFLYDNNLIPKLL